MELSDGHIKRIVVRRLDRCRICHRHYEAADVDIISRQDEMWMMSVECTDCHARNFVAAVLNEGDPEQAELALRRLTELNQQLEPIAPVAPPAAVEGDAVTASDVVDMHEFLASFDGDFAAHFRSR
jgi:hypothetical protein